MKRLNPAGSKTKYTGNPEFRGRNLIEIFLQEPERANPSAGHATDDRAHGGKKSEYIECKTIGESGGDRLHRAYRAGKNRERAGVAVEAGNAEKLERAFIDKLAQEQALYV